jgi:hypothetical protein
MLLFVLVLPTLSYGMNETNKYKHYQKNKVQNIVSMHIFSFDGIDTISPQQFNDWTARWKRKGKSYINTTNIEYFTFPMAEMTSLIAENPQTARFYIGLDSLGTTSFVPKLILVGTDGRGMPKTRDGGHIYDVSTVCPPNCGDK